MRPRSLLLLVALGVLLFSLSGSALAIAPPATFKSTGAEQRYTVPAGVRLVAVLVQGAWGGGWGGGCCPPHYTSVIGQSGASWQGLIPVMPRQTLYVEVGADGKANGGPSFGGGGAAGSPDPEGAVAASGGGATDIRTCSERASSCPGRGSAGSRILVAAGAGGNGGAEVTDAAGLLCGAATGGGQAANGQPLPKGNAAIGPVPVRTKSGIVIPGFVGGGEPNTTVTTVNGVTDAGAGSTVGGKGGSGTTCHGGGAYQSVTWSDSSVSGSPGSGPDGGAGGNAAGLKPLPCSTAGDCNDAGPGGGGGGGYFGGGGGVTGFASCTSTNATPANPCNAVTASMGGGAGSSFIAKTVLYPEAATAGGLGMGVPYAKIAPVLEIDSPANGAVYRAGQVVHASWSCSQPPGWGFGVQNCTATTAAGGAISTTPGKHTFTVHGIVATNQPITVIVTYTVR